MKKKGNVYSLAVPGTYALALSKISWVSQKIKIMCHVFQSGARRGEDRNFSKFQSLYGESSKFFQVPKPIQRGGEMSTTISLHVECSRPVFGEVASGRVLANPEITKVGHKT